MWIGPASGPPCIRILAIMYTSVAAKSAPAVAGVPSWLDEVVRYILPLPEARPNAYVRIRSCHSHECCVGGTRIGQHKKASFPVNGSHAFKHAENLITSIALGQEIALTSFVAASVIFDPPPHIHTTNTNVVESIVKKRNIFVVIYTFLVNEWQRCDPKNIERIAFTSYTKATYGSKNPHFAY